MSCWPDSDSNAFSVDLLSIIAMNLAYTIMISWQMKTIIILISNELYIANVKHVCRSEQFFNFKEIKWIVKSMW